MRHFLKDNDLSIEEQAEVLKIALELSKNPQAYYDSLKSKSIGLLFEKQSLRTRVSTEIACHNLGANPVLLRGEELHFSRGEPPLDAVRVLSGYFSGLLGRVNHHTLLEELASPNVLPIINGLSDKFHPLQSLADLLTLAQVWDGQLQGKTISYFGDGNNVAASLAISSCMAGMNVRIATPDSLALPNDVVKLASEYGKVEIFHDPKEAAKGSDILYTDVWVSMGDGDSEQKKTLLKDFQLNSSLAAQACEDVKILHCLPAHRGEEISSEVIESKASLVFKQAHNRLPATAALFRFLLA